MSTLKLWIARDKDGALHFFTSKPEEENFCQYLPATRGEMYYWFDDELFPEVTFENSPQEVELKLIENE